MTQAVLPCAEKTRDVYRQQTSEGFLAYGVAG
jgi:hypothetical protein